MGVGGVDLGDLTGDVGGVVGLLGGEGVDEEGEGGGGEEFHGDTIAEGGVV